MPRCGITQNNADWSCPVQLTQNCNLGDFCFWGDFMTLSILWCNGQGRAEMFVTITICLGNVRKPCRKDPKICSSFLVQRLACHPLSSSCSSCPKDPEEYRRTQNYPGGPRAQKDPISRLSWWHNIMIVPKMIRHQTNFILQGVSCQGNTESTFQLLT